jgi:galactokinase
MSFDISSEFQRSFHKDPEKIFFCPGRVNLIGEHIDYNGGHVMPCSISKGTWLAVSRNIDKIFRFRCVNFPETADLQVQTSYSRAGKEWFNYPLGVIHELFQEGHSLSGLDMIFYGDLPIGAGLSSSASIEVVTAFACNDLFGLNISLVDLAILSKKAENEFMGVNCGIMDQFAVAKGKEGRAILLDCDSLEHEYLPFAPADHTLVIINTRKERKLSESKYNERFAECGRALKLLKQGIEAENLCDISIGQFEEHRHLVNDPVLEKRALHVIREQARVMQAAEALRKNDIEMFGQLMYDSHQSLRVLYEVSGFELDEIVGFCAGFSDCPGARMTGAGFGGCAIALVKKEMVDEFSLQLTAHYKNVIGYEPEIFSSPASNGVGFFNSKF